MKKLFLFVAAIVTAYGASANDQIGIKHLKQFPDVIVANMGYTLEAYIINEGASSIGSGQKFDIMMSVGGDAPVMLAQSWTAGTSIAPGDSILWSSQGHVFSVSNFDGGVNDVLIWPETSTGNKAIVVDSAKKQVMYTASSAFSVYNKGVMGLPNAGPEMAQAYNITVKLENNGSWPNKNPVHLFIQFEGKTPYRIADYNGIIEPGQAAKVQVPSFVLAYYLQYCWFSSQFPQDFQLFAVEVSGTSPLAKASFQIATPMITSLENELSAGVAIYPNPAKDLISIQSPENVVIHAAYITDLSGKVVMDNVDPHQAIDIRKLPAGAYIILMEGVSGRVSRKFVKE